MAITQEQEKAYVKEGGIKCPHCGSSDIGGGFIEIDMHWAFQKMSCAVCDKSWLDEYKLTHISDEDTEIAVVAGNAAIAYAEKKEV